MIVCFDFSLVWRVQHETEANLRGLVERLIACKGASAGRQRRSGAVDAAAALIGLQWSRMGAAYGTHVPLINALVAIRLVLVSQRRDVM